MSHSRKLGILFLIFVCVCFFSLPVLSGEHPWDSDSGNGGTKSDTTLIVGDGNDGTNLLLKSQTSDTDDGGLFSLAAKATVWVYSVYYYDYRDVQKNSEVTVKSIKRRYSENNRY